MGFREWIPGIPGIPGMDSGIQGFREWIPQPEKFREFSGNFREFQGMPARVPGKFQGNFKECLEFQGIQGKFHGIPGKPREFQGISGKIDGSV